MYVGFSSSEDNVGSVGFERRQCGFSGSVGGSVGSSEDNVGFPAV